MKFVSIVLVSSMAFSSFASAKDHETFEVSGKILNDPGRAVGCGTVAVANLMEVELDKAFTRGRDIQYIPIIVTCPLSYGEDFFKLGERYRFTVQVGNSAGFDWSIGNSDALKNYDFDEEFYAKAVVKIENTAVEKE